MLLVVQNGEQKNMLCLRALFNSQAEEIKILQLSQGTSMVCLFLFMM
jgi:hypothetical protein